MAEGPHDLRFDRVTIGGGVLEFVRTSTEGDIVRISTSTADGSEANSGGHWWVGLNKEQTREAIVFLAKCLRGGDDE